MVTVLKFFLFFAFLLVVESQADTATIVVQNGDDEAPGSTAASTAPIVDLGYEVHQAVVNVCESSFCATIIEAHS